MKRIFLFAAYDKQGVIGDALLYYLRELSLYGDIVFFTDNTLTEEEQQKLLGIVKFASGEKHGEYDFGSYKRAFIWCTTQLDIASYDYCYLLNDSVYGPFYPLASYFERMEALNKDAFSLVLNPHGRDTHLQSWFIGMNKTVFTSSWFKDFILGVRVLPNKNSVCIEYETGFSHLLTEKGITLSALYKIRGKRIYNCPKWLYKEKIPFIKKSSFTRHNGSLHKQIQYILRHCDTTICKAVEADIARLYGSEYLNRMLKANRVSIALRYISYIFGKISKH